ncbi:MAG TPA: hypothetical protein VGX68_22365 [Thermoanaerobaculia bacterium]|jgi:hypothetical protein|nr:hypothetical protein [Thermoanaerobaculia bacterium]
MKRLSTILVIAVLALLAAPAFAAERVITNGVDLWRTPGDGSTYADFSKQSLPAGFFCQSSEPFTGRVVLKGIPIAAGDGRNLGLTDTIIQRLDNATFNKRGVARTRIQMRAMQFESMAPIKTACGLFKLYVTLDGQQPITTMRIVRTSEKGGRFDAPIWVNVKLSFKPVGRVSTEVLELRKALRFPPAPNAQWSDSSPTPSPAEGFVKVDTDSDGVPDTYLPGTSNFAAGRSAVPQKYYDSTSGCHVEDEGTHCPIVAY